jgi:hypothetical protein
VTTSVPKDDTCWVWCLNGPRTRALIQVVKCEFNGEDWWVTTRTMPEAPASMLAELTEPVENLNDIDHFWSMVTPVGDTLNNLSEIRSPTKNKENDTEC